MRRILSLIISLLIGHSANAKTFDSFVWASAQADGKVIRKAAILVPIEFQRMNKRFFAQLDTGSDATILYGQCLRKFDVPVDSAGDSASALRWYGFDLVTSSPQKAMMIDWNMEPDTGSASESPEDLIVGTIGLDLIVGKILVLDFPGTRYAVLEDTTQLAGTIPPGIEFVDGIVSYNKFYLSVVMDNDTIPAVRYDCGSSPAVLILPRDWWEWATGLKGTESQVIRDSVSSWGRYVHTISAPAQYDMQIGSFRVAKPEVMFLDWPDPTLATGKFMGNAAFYDSCVIVLDCIREKFGVGLRK